jgi:hypothetical protein
LQTAFAEKTKYVKEEFNFLVALVALVANGGGEWNEPPPTDTADENSGSAIS